MITEINLNNFKGFKTLVLRDLKRISLVSGKNNIGKSSLLEAFFLLLAHQSSDVFLKLASLRAVSYATPTELWESLFYNKDTEHPFRIGFRYDDGTRANLEYVREKDMTFFNKIKAPTDVMMALQDAVRNNYSLRFSFSHEKYKEIGYSIVASSTILNKIQTSKDKNALERMPHTLYINSLIMSINSGTVSWLGTIETKGLKSVLIEALRLIDDDILDVITLSMGGPAQLYIKKKKTTLPLFLAGDGLKRLLYLVAAVVTNPDTLILIDEIENGFHYSIYNQIWKLLSQLAVQYNCQIIVTTHSYEHITRALEGIKEGKGEKEFCYYRLDVDKKGHITAFRYEPKILQIALEKNLEIR